ncbi:MAG: SPOR domain-containing protein [Ancalomicrobiaceae bacterium]|nr:SPOR domain-containing protein [Ancalomicrobiaceae bacterium]
MVSESANPIERLLASGEKGRGLALLGWAGVTVFAVVSAFASWQFAGSRQMIRPVRPAAQETGDVTASIRPAARPPNAAVRTVPTPLPGDPTVGRDEFERLNQDVKDLRRLVGRIDVSTDVLARRMANLEDATNALTAGTVTRAQQTLAPIAPVASNPARPLPASDPPLRPATAVPPAQAQPPVAVSPQAGVRPPPVAQAPVGPATPAPMAAAPVHPSAAVPTSPATARVAPADMASPPGQTTVIAKTQPPRPPDKTANERSAIERATIERMLLENSAGLDPNNHSVLPNGLLPPPPAAAPPDVQQRLPAVQVQAPPIAALPQPAPVKPIAETKQPDVATTASIAPKPAAGPETPKPADATAPAKAVETPVAVAEAPAPRFAVDLGGFRSIAQVRKAWFELEAKQGKLAKSMKPLARLAESPDGIEIRLLAGPFADEAAAQTACGQLKAGAPHCGPAVYQGEPLGKR